MEEVSLFLIFFWLSLILVYFKIKKRSHLVFYYSSIVIVYVFYSLAVTKMIAFCLIVAPLVFIALGSLIDQLLNLVRIKSHYFTFIIVGVVMIFLFNFSKIEKNHTMKKPHDNFERSRELFELEVIKGLDDLLEKDNYVIFNTTISKLGKIPVMFFTNYIAYDIIPTENQITLLKDKGYKIAIFDLKNLPLYIVNDKEIIKIPIKDVQ